MDYWLNNMKELEEKILKDGRIIDNEIIKVDSFLNHQIDPDIINKLAHVILDEFTTPDKILTIESSGIAIGYAVASLAGNIPLVFAKKHTSRIVVGEQYVEEIYSFTKGMSYPVTVCKDYLKRGEKILIVDDFLAEGNASIGLYKLCKQAGCRVVGVAVAIEKGFQGGRKKLEELGLKVYSGAIIKAFKDNKPVF